LYIQDEEKLFHNLVEKREGGGIKREGRIKREGSKREGGST
jgi:hypothetical protein